MKMKTKMKMKMNKVEGRSAYRFDKEMLRR